jgi:hypothetical protein
MIDTFLLGNTYDAESKEVRDAIKSLETPVRMLASSLLSKKMTSALRVGCPVQLLPDVGLTGECQDMSHYIWRLLLQRMQR